MKIDREEALVLAKLIHPHVNFSADQPLTDFQSVLRDLDSRITEMLTSDADLEDDEEQAEPDDALDDESDEGADEDDDEEDEDDAEKAQFEIEGDELHDLCNLTVRVGDPHGQSTSIEFESDDVGCRLVSASGIDMVVDSVKRLARCLLVWRKNASVAIAFHVNRFPKEWVDALPVNELVSVV